VLALQRLGVSPAGRPFHGIRYLSAGHQAEARFRDGHGLGVRRTVLQQDLGAATDRLGVSRRAGRVDEVRLHDDHVEAAGLRARWLVAADGLHSGVRRGLGLERRAPGPARFGQRRHFRVAPATDLVEVHWSPTAEAYVTPVADDVLGVAVLGPPGRPFEDVLEDFPVLRHRIRGAAPVSSVRGAGPLRQVAVARSRGRVLLVGDAAGYVDALTGEGISTGLATAEAAVAALLAGRPEDYEQAWRRATRRYRVFTNGLLLTARRPILRRALVPAASRLPAVFAAAVNAMACTR
ncbi:MAG: NAD(P)/FAD-dependent oxidoreductase, partial [Actinomycetes bacterium]